MALNVKDTSTAENPADVLENVDDVVDHASFEEGSS